MNQGKVIRRIVNDVRVGLNQRCGDIAEEWLFRSTSRWRKYLGYGEIGYRIIKVSELEKLRDGLIAANNSLAECESRFKGETRINGPAGLYVDLTTENAVVCDG